MTDTATSASRPDDTRSPAAVGQDYQNLVELLQQLVEAFPPAPEAR
jgi:hypothetical protein